MTTLADIRDRIRIDLDDTAAERWDDETLDRHIARALRDIDNAIPREASALVATTAGSRDIDIAHLATLIQVETVEYPVGRHPPEYVRFDRWDTLLTLDTAAPPAGDDARIFYTAGHELDEVGTTLPAHLEDVLATGAAAYAVLERVPGTLNTLTAGGPAVPAEFASLGRAWMSAFRELLRHHGRANRVRSRRLSTPA
jgi:hypothetical protein